MLSIMVPSMSKRKPWNFRRCGGWLNEPVLGASCGIGVWVCEPIVCGLEGMYQDEG